VVSVAKEWLRAAGVNRVRWVRKVKNVREHRESPWQHRGYILLDPEVENFTYEIANRDELCAWLDAAVGGGEYPHELWSDRTLQRALRARLRWRLGSKQWLPFGRRAAWYGVVRALKPNLVVETGIHDGLGSTALLAAVAANGRGTVVSIDPRPRAGWLVPEYLRRYWKPVEGTSYAIRPHLSGIGVFIHDSVRVAEVEAWELETALKRRADRFALMSNRANLDNTFRDVAITAGGSPSIFYERPIGTFYPGGAIGLAVFLYPGTTEK
jgi:hypothetical protein